MARSAAEIQANLDRLTRQQASLVDRSYSDPAAAWTSARRRTGLKQQRAASDAYQRRQTELRRQIQNERHALTLAKSREESARARNNPVTTADLVGAVGVRTQLGVARIDKVNKTTVTATNRYGTSRIPFTQILQVLHPTPTAATATAARTSGS